jgi:ABC-type bacteriocin/lantibiotic exporter with double-glycine peptidase domain
MVTEMSFPFLYGKMINSVFDMIASNDSDSLHLYAGLYLGASFIEMGVKYIQKVLITEDTVRESKMKLAFFTALMDKDVEFFDCYKPGEILNRFNADFWSLYHLGPENLMSVAILICKLLASSVALLVISKELFCLHLVLFAFELYKNYSDVTRQVANWDPSAICDSMSNIANESVSNIRLVKAFSLEPKEKGKMKKAVDDLMKMRISQKRGQTGEFRAFLWKGILVVNLCYAASKIMKGEMTLGDLTTFQILSGEMRGMFPDLTWKIGNIFDHLIKAERIFEFIDYRPRMQMKEEGAVVKSSLKGDIEFRNVSFHYPLKPSVRVLKNVNLKIKNGEVVAIVGASGSGKSTVAALV